MSGAIESVRNYVKQRTGRRSLDRDVVHAVDTGCPTEAELRLSDLSELLDTIDRLNALIEAMHVERMEMIARTNDELDRLRDALAERAATCPSLYPGTAMTACRLMASHTGNHSNGTFEW